MKPTGNPARADHPRGPLFRIDLRVSREVRNTERVYGGKYRPKTYEAENFVLAMALLSGVPGAADPVELPTLEAAELLKLADAHCDEELARACPSYDPAKAIREFIEPFEEGISTYVIRRVSFFDNQVRDLRKLGEHSEEYPTFPYTPRSDRGR